MGQLRSQHNPRTAAGPGGNTKRHFASPSAWERGPSQQYSGCEAPQYLGDYDQAVEEEAIFDRCRRCCSDRDEEVHRVLLEKVLSKQAGIATAAEVTRSFGVVR